jgi:hypothetical protein
VVHRCLGGRGRIGGPAPRRFLGRRSLAVFSSAILVASCHSPSAPSANPDALPVQITTAHYVFHYSSGDAVQADLQERYHEWAVARLGVSLDRAIAYYKYRDRAQMERVTGKNANGWADPASFTVHSISSWDYHEVVHVMTALIGRPPDFFNEGIEVAMQVDPRDQQSGPRWNGVSIHDWAAGYRSTGMLPPLAEVVETDSFRRVDESKGYPIAGSFVSFMVDDRGMDNMKVFFRACPRDAPGADIERAFTAAFGVSLQDAEMRWHTYLDAR